jgi:hypothetical protein
MHVREQEAVLLTGLSRRSPSRSINVEVTKTRVPFTALGSAR